MINEWIFLSLFLFLLLCPIPSITYFVEISTKIFPQLRSDLMNLGY
uniref:ORF45a n=1 Tax=Pinus thunbergii TaxID=3350 RepID=Q32928_PINTH|nr:ORF45a [Pinus thunbergii]BAA04311.1 ORF45a [Pinus thunbergii]